MKVLLDTSFLLPFIQVEPDNISSQQLKAILNRADHVFVYSELSLFELVAKGMKICFSSALKIEDVRNGIDSIVYRSPLQSIGWIMHPNIIEMAYKIRKIHSDTIDCLIFTSALYSTECFATADQTLFDEIKRQPILFNEIASINPHILLWFDDLAHPPVLLSDI